uniref:tRNA-synt_2 domain-containing protein n=1 Tax=Echinostoma caproni TaxID=27848 RepID=A0A183ACJ5_9TREM
LHFYFNPLFLLSCSNKTISPAILFPCPCTFCSLVTKTRQVYTINPAFRAESSHTRNHLAEFYMLEAESVRLDTVEHLYESCSSQSHSQDSIVSHLSSLESSLSRPFARVSFAEACAHLKRPVDVPIDLTKEEERKVLAWMGENRPVFLTHFPCSLKPFYCQSVDGAHTRRLISSRCWRTGGWKCTRNMC